MKSQEAKGRGLFLSIAGGVALLGLVASPAALGQSKTSDPEGVAPQETIRFVKGRILIQPRAGLSDKELDKLLKPHGGRRSQHLKDINVHVVELPRMAYEVVVAKSFKGHPHIKFAELDEVVELDATTNDPYVTAWHIPKVSAPAAWDWSTGTNVTVAVIDSGVDGTHPDLIARMVPGWNFYDGNTNTADVKGHGTAVAGVVAGTGNNGIGVAGISWNTRIMPLRVSDTTGYSSFSKVAEAITWAANKGARVATISISNVSTSSSVLSAAQYMRSKGGVVVVSGGNTGAYKDTLASPYVTAVSSTDSSDAISSFSSFGPSIDMAAPGSSIRTTNRGGDYGLWQGTSFAAPIVAGTYALMISANPTLAPSTLDNALFTSALDLGTTGYDQSFGHGRVHAAAAVTKAKTTVQSDTQAPGVSITSPSASSTVRGLVSVGVTATDNVGVTKVSLYAGSTLIATDTAAPFAFSWDTSSLTDGPQTLKATAYDAAGNVTSASISVTVGNDTTAPTVSISNPTTGAKVSGSVGITVGATDNKQVSKISLLIDGKEVAVSYGTSLSYTWSVPSNKKRNSTSTSNITARAYDAANNMGSNSVTVYK